MKILHTADWHIGQNFFGYDRRDEHLFFFEWLKTKIHDEKADVLLITGDIFDSPNPSALSQKTYYRFLRDISTDNPQLQIIITAGNHDSAGRLEAPNPLLEEMNIVVKGIVKRTQNGEIEYDDLFIPLYCNGEQEAWCIAVPFLRQGDFPPAETYSLGIASMYDNLYQAVCKTNQKELPVILTGHLQATGSEISDNDRSERTIIGGLECVSPETFQKKNIVYTALGHLHKAQRVSGKENIRYAGSPLPMSFAEKNYKQGINLIQFSEGMEINITRIPFEPPVELLSIPVQPLPLENVLDEIAQLPDGEISSTSPYLEIKVSITGPEPSMRFRIEQALKGKSVRLARLVPYITKKEKDNKIVAYEELMMMNPLEMAEDVFLNKYENPMPDELKTLFLEVMREVQV